VARELLLNSESHLNAAFKLGTAPVTNISEALNHRKVRVPHHYYSTTRQSLCVAYR
jgi:hypothetical protein